MAANSHTQWESKLKDIADCPACIRVLRRIDSRELKSKSARELSARDFENWLSTAGTWLSDHAVVDACTRTILSQKIMASATDWISAICAILATVFSLVTLLTVYIAAIQLITQRRVYRLGLSPKALGPWQSKVVSRFFLLGQRNVSTRRVRLPVLVKKNESQEWEPHITFPAGISCTSESFWKSKVTTPPDLEAGPQTDLVLAEASWVNFLEALDIEPKDESVLYHMSFESELVNGTVPMRWKGTDLVGICCVLGFQTYEEQPSYREPMPLPTQWLGPLGWLQFRESSGGCIAEFRRRVAIPHQLSGKVHKYFKTLAPDRPLRLTPRLWQSINGLYLKNKRILYLGGTDKENNTRVTVTRKKRRKRRLSPEASNGNRSPQVVFGGEGHQREHQSRAGAVQLSDRTADEDTSDDEIPPQMRGIMDRLSISQRHVTTMEASDDSADSDEAENCVQRIRVSTGQSPSITKFLRPGITHSTSSFPARTQGRAGHARH